MLTLNINRVRLQLDDADPDTPLLWVLRDSLGLVGTKYGCGVAQCGACTVHIDGNPARACVTPIGRLQDREITTIEGVAPSADRLHRLQQAWIEEDVAQCGYCQSGQIMSALALLNRNPRPTDDQIKSAMSGNLCRCGTYLRIVRAIKNAAGAAKNQ